MPTHSLGSCGTSDMIYKYFSSEDNNMGGKSVG